MDFLYKIPVLKTRADVLSFFLEALDYRETHREESEKIALFVFDATHPNLLGAIFDEDIEVIRNEFGALEAPGQPEVGNDPEGYRDTLWGRLMRMVEDLE